VNPGTNKLSAESIVAAVGDAGLSPLPAGVAERFSTYFDLLDHWNTKLNLTAIRNTGEILRRHFVECIFCAQMLPAEIVTLLDYGSGAGFPGIPIALCRPEIRVTLAESQGKKAGFLREAVRTLSLDTEVYSGRVEEMGPGRLFDAVALRAVDRMREAIRFGAKRVAPEGWLVLLAAAGDTELPDGFCGTEAVIPASERQVVVLAQRRSVPRGTRLEIGPN
jgi:16S rRNA (guanine527-N7)-methyltransferase